MDISFLTPIVLTFLLSAVFSIVVLHLFPKIGLLDRPQNYGHKRDPIPYPTGIAPVFALLISLLLFLPFDMRIGGLIVAALLLFGVSFWDDRSHLPAWFRLIIHILAASIAVFSGIEISYLGNPFGETLDLSALFDWLPKILTVVWIVFFANVMNWLDGVPGLATASTAAAGSFLGLLSLSAVVAQPEVALLSFLLAASCLGFLLFNLPAPSMLLGDSGAMVFGFFLAVLTVFSGGKMATAFIVLMIPMLDFFSVFLGRILDGQSPFRGKDQRHLHDRLALVGFSDREILFFFLTISIFLGWLSLQLQTMGKLFLILGTAITFLLFSAFLSRMIRRKKHHVQ